MISSLVSWNAAVLKILFSLKQPCYSVVEENTTSTRSPRTSEVQKKLSVSKTIKDDVVLQFSLSVISQKLNCYTFSVVKNV